MDLAEEGWAAEDWEVADSAGVADLAEADWVAEDSAEAD